MTNGTREGPCGLLVDQSSLVSSRHDCSQVTFCDDITKHTDEDELAAMFLLMQARLWHWMNLNRFSVGWLRYRLRGRQDRHGILTHNRIWPTFVIRHLCCNGSQRSLTHARRVACVLWDRQTVGGNTANEVHCFVSQMYSMPQNERLMTAKCYNELSHSRLELPHDRRRKLAAHCQHTTSRWITLSKWKSSAARVSDDVCDLF